MADTDQESATSDAAAIADEAAAVTAEAAALGGETRLGRGAPGAEAVSPADYLAGLAGHLKETGAALQTLLGQVAPGDDHRALIDRAQQDLARIAAAIDDGLAAKPPAPPSQADP